MSFSSASVLEKLRQFVKHNPRAIPPMVPAKLTFRPTIPSGDTPSLPFRKLSYSERLTIRAALLGAGFGGLGADLILNTIGYPLQPEQKEQEEQAYILAKLKKEAAKQEIIASLKSGNPCSEEEMGEKSSFKDEKVASKGQQQSQVFSEEVKSLAEFAGVTPEAAQHVFKTPDVSKYASPYNVFSYTDPEW